MTIKNFVLTGGPCGGKTTAINTIRFEYTKRGYTVLTMAETATELINGGIAPWTCGSNGDFQSTILYIQLMKENGYRYAAASMKADKILIIYDRGAMDNRGYMNDEEFAAALKFVGVSVQDLLGRYDAVFHLETAAKNEDESAYSNRNNSARYETPKEAIRVDDSILAAWKDHPHHYIIKNAPTIEAKIEELVKKIDEMLQ